jgi:hypothetical protein
MSAGKSHVRRRRAVQTRHKPAQEVTRAIRWVKWIAAILNVLVKFYPAETAALRQVFPSRVMGRVESALRRRFRNCLRYIDCTRIPVDRRRMRRRV